MTRYLWIFAALILLFTGCSTDNSSSELTGTGNGNLGEEEDIVIKEPAYHFANGCYILKSVANGSYIEATRGSYQISAKELEKAESFFMKPSALGEYMLHDSQASCMRVLGNQVVIRSSNVTNNSRWEIFDIGNNQVALRSFGDARWLAAVSGSTRIILTDKLGPNCRFKLEAAQGCKPFPEAELNVDIKDRNGNPVAPEDAMARPAVGNEITGFADVHVHLNHFLASGQTTFVGETFNPLGIAEALRDCSPLHGKNGATDLLGMVQDGNTSHNTDGWPTFSFWPTAYSQTHQQAYYKWIERAWLSGQRLMVQEMVNAEVLAVVKNGLIKPQVEILPQDDISIVESQIRNMYDMQDYIDAQCGGPGKGWFRICKSSTEARQAISEGKMAVILAIEVDTLCGGDRDYFDDFEQGLITRRELDAKLQNIRDLLDKYYELGIRTIFPIHGINNGYGGAWLYVNMVWDLGNKVMRNDFYDIRLSPDPRVTYKETGIEYTAAQALLIDFLNGIKFDLPFAPEIPPYDPDSLEDMGFAPKGHANGMGLTKLGEWLIQKLIDKGFVIEVDHMCNKTVNRALEIIWENKYPGVIATHGGITDIEPVLKRVSRNNGTHEQLDIPRMIMIMQLGGLFSEHIAGSPPTYAGPGIYGNEFCYLDYLSCMINLSRDNKNNPGAVKELNNGNALKNGYFRYHTRKNDETGKYEEYPYKVPTSWYNLNVDESDDLWLGQPMTTDVNGACSLPQADETTEGQTVVSYDPDGFGTLYPGLYNDVVDESKVRFHKQVTGNRTFDINKEGMAHYGLMPDEIKFRQVKDPNLKLDAFFSGTEAYLRMLNRVERYHRDPNYPSRDPKYWNLQNYEDWWGWKEENR